MKQAAPAREARRRDDPLGAMPSTTSVLYAQRSSFLTAFDLFAAKMTRWAGSPIVFSLALMLVLFYAKLAERAKQVGPHKEMHSIDEEGMPVQGDLSGRRR